MVARGRGKKSATASEAVAAVPNGIDAQDNEVAGASEVAAAIPAKKSRGRGAKKEVKEEVETESAPAEVAEKPEKPAKVAKVSKKAAKGKAPVEENNVKDEELPKDEEVENGVAASDESKQAAPEKKAQNRKRKGESTEKPEEAAQVAKKAPKATKTKGAKKETVDSDGVPENPNALSNNTTEAPQTNGNKKPPTNRKRGAPKIEELPVSEPINEENTNEEAEAEIAPPPAKSKSKAKPAKKETKKIIPKAKAPKKAPKEEEESLEDDVLPEDEFVPEIEEEEEEEEPKPKKAVKSKGSRKQLKDDTTPVEEEEAPVLNNDVEKAQDSEIEPTIVEEEPKTKGKKTAAAKKVPAKKVAPKKPSKGKKGKEESDDLNNEEQDADVVKSKPKTNGSVKSETDGEKKSGRGRKRKAVTPVEDEADVEDGQKSTKNAKPEGLLNPIVTEYNASDFTLDKDFKLKISSWNIAGLRSWLKKDGLDYLQHEQPDILCLQEIKCTPDQLPEEARIPGYHPYWLCMPGGHAGVAVYSKIMPINVEYGIGNAIHDDAGRMITAEYEKFYLICVYVPNSGRKLVNLEQRMKWEELFREYVQRLDKVKPVIIAGDMNVSHKEIDLANPKTNTKNAGFTPQERDAMTKLLEAGYVDTFRHIYPEKKGSYTFWSYMGKARSKNVGWRLDYFIVSERIIKKVVESTIRAQILGSDHCPITLFLNI